MAHIIVIENEPSNLELMCHLLEVSGHSVTTAIDSDEGLELVRWTFPELVIWGIPTSRSDGDEVVRVLKNDVGLSHIPLVAVTSKTLANDGAGSQEKVFDGYIYKPIKPEVFVSEVENFLANDGRKTTLKTLDASLISIVDDAELKRSKILVVDDHAFHRKFLAILLGRAGYLVLDASDGAQALEIVRQEHIALVISDILMPVMDGIEFANRLHADPAISHIPIIFYTATYRASEVSALAQTCGVTTVLSKPVASKTLLETVAAVLDANSVAIDQSTADNDRTLPFLPEFAKIQQRLRTVFLDAGEGGPTTAEPGAISSRGSLYALDKIHALSLRTAALLELSMVLSLEREPQKLLELFCRAAQNIMRVKQVAVGTRGSGSDRRCAMRGMGDAEVDAIFNMLEPDNGPLCDVLLDGKPLHTRAMRSHFAFKKIAAAPPLQKADLLVPVSLKSYPRGWLYVADKCDANGFNEEDEQFVTMLAAQLAPIYENLLLCDEVQRHAGELSLELIKRTRITSQLRESNRLYEILSAINSAIVRIRDRDELLQEACRILVRHGAFSLAWIGVIDPDTLHGKVVAWSGNDVDSVENIKLTAREDAANGNWPAWLAMREMRPVICNNLQIDPVLTGLRPLSREPVVCSIAAWPIVIGNRAAAVMELHIPKIDFFNEEQIKLLDELAGDLSFGLEFIQKDEELSYLAYYDLLTGLPNNTLFWNRLMQFIHGAKHDHSMAVVIMIDLQHFARLNDVMGRHAGDALLREAAKRLDSELGERYNVARVGGHTFAVAITGLQRDTDVIPLLEQQIFDVFNRPFVMEHQEVSVRIRAGLALYPEDGEDAEALCKHAEAALNNAKLLGENYLYYAPQMNVVNAARLALENELRVALERQQFIVYYQPRVDLLSGRIVGAEALIRWRHPQRGLILPTEFIPLAEEIGLMALIGAWISDAVCAQQAAWLAGSVGAVPVAVNLSATQLKQGHILQTIRSAIDKYKLPPQYIEFELTETILINDLEAARNYLQALKALGVKLSLDDFGTGYSSLSYLKRFPFDFVKIDQSFISGITHNPEDAAIAIAVIQMAHSLKLRVVAEGVETEGQLNYLRRHRCDEIQGYYFSKPVPVADFETMLRKEKRLIFGDEIVAPGNTLLIVDDEPNILSTLRRVLRQDGYTLLLASSGAEALEILALNTVRVIVSDHRMPGMSGAEFLGRVKKLYPDTIRIILSGYADLQVIAESVNRGEVFKFLTKPWSDDLLREHIRDAFERYRPPP